MIWFIALNITWLISYIYSVYKKVNVIYQQLCFIDVRITKDLSFVDSYVKNSNLSLPILADCIVVRKNDILDVKSIFSCTNLPDTVCRKIKNDYTLIYNGSMFHNQFIHYHLYEPVQVASFSIPMNKFISKISFDIKDESSLLIYHVNTKVLSQPRRKKRIAICSYISDYNSVNEVMSWIAYNKMVGIDSILLYAALPLKNTKEKLSNLINNGYVRWYKFNWPLHVYLGFEQYSVQKQHINSCYYRHRHEYEYIFIHDIDEYVLSKKNPYNVYESIKSMDNNKYNVFDVVTI